MSSEVLDKKRQIVLPYNTDQFAGFITSLLGRPQTISQKYAFPFEIKVADVLDTYNLVEQRVHDQNKADLVQFNVDVAYNDGSSVTLSSIEDFMNYKDIKPLIPSSITLSWTYLITFQKRTVPEKQSIEIELISHSSHYSASYSFERSDQWFDYALGRSQITIKHTSRSWGTDIKSLLDNHLKSYERQESSVRKWLREKREKISKVFFLGMLAIGFTGVLITTNLLTSRERITAEKLLGADASADLGQKIDFLIAQAFLGVWPQYFMSAFIFTIVLFIVSIFGANAIEEMAKNEEPSFILLSKAGEKHKREISLKLSKTWKRYFFVLIGGVFTGVIANIVFSVLWL